MKKLLGGVIVFGGVVVGAALGGLSPAAAQCDPSAQNCFGTGVGSIGGVPTYAPPAYTPPVRSYNPGYVGERRHHRRAARHYRPNVGWGAGYYGGYVDRHVPYYAPRPRYYSDDYYYEDEPVYRVEMSAAHVDWCAKRYRTYRVSDNTFKPTKNTRRQCVSPYS
ncbi:MAG: BA14K family protein [Rhizobiaceae bacterium]